MIPNLPAYISIAFILITLLTVYLFYKASHRSKTALSLITAWLILHGTLAYIGYFSSVTNILPPRIMIAFMPTFLLIIYLFVTKKGRAFIDHLDLKTLTILHTIRIPVELVLWGLFIHKAIPELMTFEGRNFDILAGLTAPLTYFAVFQKQWLSNRSLLIWNIVCLGLVSFIAFNGTLSAPSPIQQFAFDQPNIALLYFPMIWLPACVVPIVIFSHLAAIRQLTRQK